MRRALFLMVFLGNSASGLSLTGPPLPSPYSVTGNYIDGPFQIITANRQVIIRGEPSGTYDSLLVVRQSRSGKTLWKTYLEGALRLELLGKGQGVVVISAVEGGALAA